MPDRSDAAKYRVIENEADNGFQMNNGANLKDQYRQMQFMQ